MKITIADDFDLDKIIGSGQCFRPKKISENTYRFITGDHVVEITDEKTHFSVSCTKEEWDSIWHTYFDLDTNYRKIRESIPGEDKYLRTAAAKGAGIRILRQDKFEMLISFIISQNNNIKRISGIVERLCEGFGEPICRGGACSSRISVTDPAERL